MLMNVPPSALVAFAGLMLLSIDDIRRREISEKHVAVLIIILVLVDVAARPWRIRSILPLGVYLALNLVLMAGLSLAALLGMLGWGDVAAAAIMLIATPTVPREGSILPTLMVVLFYYLAIMLAYILYNLARNIVAAREELKKLPSFSRKLLYAMMARPRRVKDIIERPGWWYPLSLCGKYSLRFNIYLDPPDIAEMVRKAVKKGCVSPDSMVWVSYGIPAIPLLVAAYGLALLVGDKPLLALLFSLARIVNKKNPSF